MKILLLTKPTFWGNIVQNYIEENIKDSKILIGDWGIPMPQELFDWNGDYIISFLSPWILPEEVLNKTKIAALNFHPAPPKYPGIGCYNYAIYNNEKEYGVTCHYMSKKVDSGDIVAVKMFPLHGNESVLSLKEKSMTYMTKLFYEIMDFILNEKELPKSSEKWAREAYTRIEFQELCKMSLTMSKEELIKRIRATYFPGALDYPSIELGGKKYFLIDSKEFLEFRK